MDFWQIIMTPFSWLLKVFCQVFNSYGVALILFTVIIKIILFPFSLKNKKSQIKMNLVSGQTKELQKRYGHDRERYNQELQKFYAENNINPFGGCGWMMIPLLILWPLYAIIRRPLKYLMGLNDAAITTVAGALGYENFMVGGTNELTLASMMNSGNLATAGAAAGTGSLFIINFNFLGLDLSQIPTMRFWENGVTWGSFGLFLLPVISAVVSFFSMLVSMRTNQINKKDKDSGNSGRSMLILQPVISLWFGFAMPAGMCVYWIANSLLMVVQEIVCGRILKKDYEEAQRALEEQARKNKEEEKERRRKAAERKAAAIAANKGKSKKVQPQSRNKGVDLSASRVGMRAYARGRAYDPNRYPVTPYRDPDGVQMPVENMEEELNHQDQELLTAPVLPDEEPVAGAEQAEHQEEDTMVSSVSGSEDEKPNG